MKVGAFFFAVNSGFGSQVMSEKGNQPMTIKA